MKKLVLIIPPSPWLMYETDLPALGILYLSSYVKQYGYEVDVCDLNGLPLEEDWKIPVGDIYGITGSSANFPYMKRISELLRNRQKNCKIVAGGPHVSAIPEYVLDNTKVDICVVGEGERALLWIMNNSYKSNIIKGEETYINAAPFPDRRAIDIYKYMEPQIWGFLGKDREATIFTSRGCPFNCKFCVSPFMWKRKVRYYDMDSIFEEIDMLIDEYDVSMFHVLDDTFITNKARVKDFCDYMGSKKLKWHCLNRVDCSDLDQLRFLKKSGCMLCQFGFESGSNYMLKIMGKGTTIEQTKIAIENCATVGLRIRGQFIVGFPGETNETIDETVRFINYLRSYDAVMQVHPFIPYPGCEVWNNYEFYKKEYNYYIDKENPDFSLYKYNAVGQNVFPFGDCRLSEWYNYVKYQIGRNSIELQR